MTDATRVALVGREILASRSPWLHEQEARAQGFALRYELVDFSARGLNDDELPSVLAELAARGYAGTNVTYPFKQAVLPLLTRLSPEARRIGAVNTIRFRGAESIGFNTDVTGFADGLRAQLGGASFRSVVQLGAGGGGSATAFALLDLGVQHLALADIDPGRALSLHARLTSAFPDRAIVVIDDLAAAIHSADGIVNATPVGMAKSPGTPVALELLAPRHWVADIVYFPLETQLLCAAAARGCRVINGSAMAIGQAAVAFEIFTERVPDRARMLESFYAFRTQ